MRTAEKLASSIGKGLVAGLAGTAAMTVSSTLEAQAPAPQAEFSAGPRDGQGAGDHVLRR